MVIISLKLFCHCTRKSTLFPFLTNVRGGNGKNKIYKQSNVFLDMSGMYFRSFPSKFCNNFAVEISVSIHKRNV